MNDSATTGDTPTIIVPITIEGRSFRIMLGGENSALSKVLEQLPGITALAPNEEEFLAQLEPVLAEHGVILAEVLDLNPGGGNPFLGIFESVFHVRTADRALTVLRLLFADADTEDLDQLLAPARLVHSRSIIQSVLADLDEYEEQARGELAALLPPTYATVLVL